MKSSKGLRCLLCSFTLASAFVAGWVLLTAVAATADDASVACTDCHEDKQNAEYVHYPAREGDCRFCHEPAPEHLENGGPGGMKTDRTASACYQCHDPVNKGKTVHPALAMEGECTQCHNPHGSTFENLLVRPKNTLCLECHAEIPAEAGQVSKHSVILEGKSCLNCHDPHASDFDPLLVSSPKSLCLTCHDREIEITANNETREIVNISQKVGLAFPHKPATWDNGCIICHKPHGSRYNNLLIEPFPVKNYREYQPGDSKTKNTFELCFTCHNRALLNREITADGTGFRNDTIQDGKVVRENLHWFHVVFGAGSDLKARGRSCNICHNPHGADQPHAINSSWTMSKNYEPMLLYISRQDGGECMKSCHRQKIYQRIE